MCQDERGFLWIATLDGGVFKFDGVHCDPLPLPDSLALGVVQIASQGAHLWLGTLQSGVVRYSDDQLQATYNTSNGLPSNVIMGLRVEADDSLSVFTDRGLGRIADGQCINAITDLGGGPVGIVFDMATDASGASWLATLDHGVVGLDGHLLHSDCAREERILRTAWKMISDEAGRMWVLPRSSAGNTPCLLCYDPTRQHFELLEPARQSPPPARRPEALHFRMDRQGRAWIACGGAHVYDGAAWTEFTPYPRPPDGRTVRLTYEDRNGNIWLALAGLGRVLCATNAISYYTGDADPAADVQGLATDASGAICAATPAGDRRVATEGHCDAPPRPPQDPAQPAAAATGKGPWGGGKQIPRPHAAPPGSIYLASAGGRLEWVEKRLLDALLAAAPTPPSALLLDRDGRIWLGLDTHSDALQCHHRGRQVTPDGSGTGHIRFVTALCQDRAGTIWIGTRMGLFSYEPNFGAIYINSIGDVLGNAVSCLASDTKGRLWIGGKNGVACYDGNTFFPVLPAGPWSEHGVDAMLCDAQDRLWIGNRHGLLSYPLQQAASQVYVREVACGQVYHRPDKVDLQQGAIDLHVRFQGLNFNTGPHALVYSHRLIGNDEEWSDWSPRTDVRFSGLAPGHYRFEVKAAHRHSTPSRPASVTIDVPHDKTRTLNQALNQKLVSSYPPFIAESETILAALRQADLVAATDLTLLLIGETGTGKGLFARHIHSQSERAAQPFIQLNCGAIPEGLIESELFGHEKGAFTGAVSRKIGHFELADGGTLFLDEIGDLPLDSQRVLLHILEENTLTRVGGGTPIPVDVRVIAATNRDLREAIDAGTFREDLFFRLSVFTVELPPLRKRRVDIELLVHYFIEQGARRFKCPPPAIDDDALRLLKGYAWPGNIRELEHVVQRAVITHQDGEIRSDDLMIPNTSAAGANATAKQKGGVAACEKQRIYEALESTHWVVYGDRGAAKLLGMHPEKLRGRMRKYGLKKKVARPGKAPERHQRDN